MKAYRTGTGAEAGLQWVDLAPRALGAHEVRVRMQAVSLNYRDVMVASGHYPVAVGQPILASDGAGEVVEVGSEVSRFRVGDRVVTTFFQDWASGPQPARAELTALGAAIDGVLAEEVVLGEQGLLPVPAHFNARQAATLPVAGVTAWTSLFVHGGARPGDTVLLLGTGGVSIWALQLAKAAGLRVIITSSSDDKLAQARALGADRTVNYRRHPEWQDEVLKLTDGLGADLTVEVGGAGTLPRSIAATRVGGTIALVGVLTGMGESINPLPLLIGAKRLQGVLVGSREHQEQLQRFVATSGLAPVIDRVFPFAQAPEALAYLKSGQHFGKVLIEIG
ncbi:zinc-dependent alcohol dehydrogenase family protein [Caldimonas brevitalea]|uniref:NADPH:quinone oxidoreductase n=1 Tax=Caldimonas brevitalea TaxID=413882 RepID=A0A0G3BRB4_9BURK|nr:NAD(P)-dependent alcohol dehydrogenase [Caldimonas brevitalea]AKJ29090.1 NADPH:quinone oxidoreductase [Caldimonas brevitalea]